MILISLFGFFGTSTVTIFSAGILSFAALFIFAIVVTSLPMILLLREDFLALDRNNVKWPSSRKKHYFAAIILPAWFMTPLYILRRGQMIRR